MTLLNVEEAELQVARGRDHVLSNTWCFGLVCGAVLVGIYNGHSWWMLCCPVVIGLLVALQKQGLAASESDLAAAVKRRDEWRHERLTELHEEELAEYRRVIANLQRELDGRAKLLN